MTFPAKYPPDGLDLVRQGQTGLVPILRRVHSRSGARSINAQVARALGVAIVSGAIAADQKLPAEQELLARYDISRTVLREALKILGAKGLIASRTNVGTWVLDRSHWQLFDADVLDWHAEHGIDRALLADMFEFRLAIEPAGAGLVARYATAGDIVALHAALAAMRATTDDAQAFGEADANLHSALARISGNLLMRGSANVIETSLMAVYAALGTPLSGRSAGAAKTHGRPALRQSLALHEAIVEAIAQGDSLAAGDAMTRAIEFERHAVFANP